MGHFCKPSCDQQGLTEDHVWGTPSCALGQRLFSEKKKSKFLILSGTVAKTLQHVPKGIQLVCIACVPVVMDEIFLQIFLLNALGMG